MHTSPNARRLLAPAFVALLAAVILDGTLLGHAQAPAPPAAESRVDEVFARWTSTTPGCAVGIAREGKTLLEKGYGMADLEHDTRNTADTIFEAGSVSKQFTAAAVLILAREGKLSLDDPARKYIPELPDYDTTLTIRHMLTHTSGLRDWGSVAGIGGWPRTTRAYTHAHVLDIVSRQRALNFAPGTNWSYSNTGYNLAAIIVARVSGQSFADFCHQRLFEPLGMAHTSWRDDYTRIVRNRAIAYADARDGLHIQMPFENVHGNGGLLTTVGDLLKWNEHFDRPGPEDIALTRTQQQPAQLKTGLVLDYSLGLYIRRYKGIAEVAHSGSTAGYRAFLARYPDRQLSVAVLCNASSGAAERYAHAVADLYLGTENPAARAQPAATPAARTLDSRAGMYRNLATGSVLVIVRDKDAFRLEGGPALVAGSGTRLELPEAGRVIDFETPSGAAVRLSNGLVERYERVAQAHPSVSQLRELKGTYRSDEAEVEFDVVADGGQLTMRRRPDTAVVLRPLYTDAFAAPGVGTIRFHRHAGRVTEFSIVSDRVWDLRFRRTAPTTLTSAR